MISKVSKQLTERYLDNPDIDLHEEIAKLAQDNNLSAQSIERVANRVNRNIIVGLQKNAVQGGSDPHFTFPTVKTANIIAMIRAKKPSAIPTLPEPVAPEPINLNIDSGLPSRAHEVRMSDYVGKEVPDRAIAVNILQMLKLKVSEKKSALCKIEFALEEMVRKFEKQASHKIMSGTPIEVFYELPVKDIVDNLETKLAGLCKIAHINERFDIDHEDPTVNLAFEISEARDLLDGAKAEYTDALEDVELAKRDVREFSV